MTVALSDSLSDTREDQSKGDDFIHAIYNEENFLQIDDRIEGFHDFFSCLFRERNITIQIAVCFRNAVEESVTIFLQKFFLRILRSIDKCQVVLFQNVLSDEFNSLIDRIRKLDRTFNPIDFFDKSFVFDQFLIVRIIVLFFKSLDFIESFDEKAFSFKI